MTARAIYIRTSTRVQDGEAQMHVLRQAAQARGWTEYHEYRDIGQSGAGNPPELSRLHADIAAGRINEVMVYALDRVGRSVIDLLHRLDAWERAGAALVSLHESIDLGSAIGRMQVQVIAAMAQFERAMVRSRVQDGVDRARACGRVGGRPKRRFTPEQLAHVERRRAEGIGWPTIAEEIGWPESTLRLALRRENPPANADRENRHTEVSAHAVDLRA